MRCFIARKKVTEQDEEKQAVIVVCKLLRLNGRRNIRYTAGVPTNRLLQLRKRRKFEMFMTKRIYSFSRDTITIRTLYKAVLCTFVYFHFFRRFTDDVIIMISQEFR